MRLLIMADLVTRERMRSFSFLAMSASCLVMSFLLVPNAEGDIRMLLISPDVFRQASNATWAPVTAASAMCFALPLFGFVYVRGAIEIDRETGMLDLLLSGSLSRLRYVVSKVVSSCALLVALLSITACGTLVATLVRYPSQRPGLWVVVSPFLAILPGVVFTASAAVLAEASALARRRWFSSAGIVAYLAIYAVSVSWSAALVNVRGETVGLDVSGIGWIYRSIYQAAIASSGATLGLRFGGLVMRPGILGNLAILAALCVTLIIVAALLLERGVANPAVGSPACAPVSASAVGCPVAASARYRPAPIGRPCLLGGVGAELLRLLGATSLSWALGAAGLWIATWCAPTTVERFILLPVLFGWMVPALSFLGSEERRSGVLDYLATIPNGPMRQLAASAMAAAGFGLVLAAPSIVRAALEVGAAPALVIVTWALAFPLLALALGNLSGSARLFQTAGIIMVYLSLNSARAVLPLAAAPAVVMAAIYAGIAVGAVAVVAMQRTWVRAR